MGTLNIEDDGFEENPYATKAPEKREITSTFTGYDAQGTPYRQSRTTSAVPSAKSSGTIAPRSNFARPKVGILTQSMCAYCAYFLS